jgi:hypothetical protein
MEAIFWPDEKPQQWARNIDKSNEFHRSANSDFHSYKHGLQILNNQYFNPFYFDTEQ